MKDKGYMRLLILYAMYFIPLGASSYTAVFLGGRGMTNAQIGILSSIPPLIALTVQPLWGMASDRAHYKRSVLSVCFFLSAAASLWVDRAYAFIPLMLAMTGFNAAAQGLMPISTSICMEYTQGSRHGFGPIRLAGSISYQLVVLLLGFILSEGMPNLYRIMSILYIACGLYALLAPPVRGYQYAEQKVSPFAVLKDRRILFLFSMTFCGKAASIYSVSFYNKYAQELFGSNSAMSVLAFLAVLPEIPFLMVSNRIMRKFRVTTWALIGFGLTALRFLGIASARSFWLMTLLQIPQVAVMACFEFYPSLYLNSIVDKKLRSSVQSVSTLVTFGLTQLSGSLLGGFLADTYGIQTGFLVYGLFLLAAIAVYFVPARNMNMVWED
ncbi:MAG: MFS transporter [Christensenellales bacterium]|jgi:PPP family 3-phenylpropionic acid transporter